MISECSVNIVKQGLFGTLLDDAGPLSIRFKHDWENLQMSSFTSILRQFLCHSALANLLKRLKAHMFSPKSHPKKFNNPVCTMHPANWHTFWNPVGRVVSVCLLCRCYIVVWGTSAFLSWNAVLKWKRFSSILAFQKTCPFTRHDWTCMLRGYSWTL